MNREEVVNIRSRAIEAVATMLEGLPSVTTPSEAAKEVRERFFMARHRCKCELSDQKPTPALCADFMGDRSGGYCSQCHHAKRCHVPEALVEA